MHSGRLVRDMIDNINIRFAFVLNVNSEKFDPIFSVATLLSPKWCPSLADSLAEVAKTEIKRMVPFYVF